MGAFLTNVHVRVPEGITTAALVAQVRAAVEARLATDGFALSDSPADRELVIVPGRRWLAFYDVRAEDQDETIEVWARELSRALGTEAFSVLVHDSDVMVLALFARGKLRDRFDSDPAFSGRRPSKLSPTDRATRWSSTLAPGHPEGELVAAFTSKHVLAEAALALLAPAIGADVGLLATGYNYLTSDGEVPSDAVRLHARYRKRPPWERRAAGPPRLASRWDQYETRPEPEPQRVLVGAELRATTVVMNRGGASVGVTIAITLSSDALAVTAVEVVIAKAGRHAMDRHAVPVVWREGRWVAELPDAQLQPGFAGDLSDLAGAPTDAMLDAHNAGQIHLNLIGRATRPERIQLAVEVTPHGHAAASHVEQIVVDVEVPRGVPLRVTHAVYPYQLDRITTGTHSHLLVLLDAPRDVIKEHAIALLRAVRSSWPDDRWDAAASDDRYEVGHPMKPKRTDPWPVLERAIRATRGRVTATSTPRGSEEDGATSGLEICVLDELGVIAIWLASERTEPEAVEREITRAVDRIARTGSLVQAILARWQIAGDGSTTPYEDAVRIQGAHLATRGWCTTWLRGIGVGQLWLGPALRARVAGPLADAIDLGPAIRIAVYDVAETERRLASLLPTLEESEEYERAHPTDDDDDE